jgi:hypothetical protein
MIFQKNKQNRINLYNTKLKKMAKIKQMEKEVNKNVHTEKAAPKGQPQADPKGQPQTAPKTEAPKQKPVFDEIEGMDPQTALSVLIQAAEMAQKSGALSMRDAVILAKAIDTIVPGKI